MLNNIKRTSDDDKNNLLSSFRKSLRDNFQNKQDQQCYFQDEAEQKKVLFLHGALQLLSYRVFEIPYLK